MASLSKSSEAHAKAVLQGGATVLPGALPLDLVDALAAAFPPLLDEAVRRDGAQGNRGPHRYYVTLPFVAPWANVGVIDNPAVTAVMDAVLGPDAVVCQLASDTPLLGSVDQEPHRDIGPLFPEAARPTPPYLLAVNIPLVDITLENGPTEVVVGSHRRSDADALARMASGETPMQPVLMRRGDVMIRDVRHIHRGTANRTRTPRPMLVVGYQRPWFHRQDVDLAIPRRSWERLPDGARHRLRFARIEEGAKRAAVVERTVLPPPVRAP